MEQLGKLSLNGEILNSLIFFFMLGIVLTNRGIPEATATKSLRAFIEEGKENGTFHHEEVLGKYLEVAYSKLPSSFLHMMSIPTTIADGIRTIDTNYGWVNKL